MLKKIITTMLVVSTVATSSLAMAEPWHDRDGDRHGYDHRGDYRDHRDYRDGRGWEHRHEDWDDHRGHWSRGDRLPPRYRGDYVDWREHHLPYPPRGHRWVRVNGDYLLIAIATGIITGTILSR
ncbi:hypothetical protein P255_00826 [Acinetobacter brisouii CIP 110357]|uniref:Integral membrane protein n=1 Tax=Acinetobacter brisouii CIP 110357 TaxID=1341683 RepID=V2UVL1_9GAMM|nr:RcnB family protein [Acinetobacter brisouii]ENV46678.1 hypothetical protein F954_02666 [Acinetobacter brisouii ANC 4119]ESK52666.1 hypothetical protein P255_00826 [Acinetobacter brisouii CIP 110357]